MSLVAHIGVHQRMDTPTFKTIEAIYGLSSEEMPNRIDRAVLVAPETE